MVLDEERISMKIQAMGRAIMELSSAGEPVTEHSITEKLEQHRRRDGRIAGLEAVRGATEVVSDDCMATD